MAENTQAEVLMNSWQVMKFFPADLADIVEFPEKDITYLGIHRTAHKDHKGALVVSQSLYLVAAVNNMFLDNNDISLDMKESTKRWISNEGYAYDYLTQGKYHEVMYGYSPLLVLRIINRTLSPEEPFKFAELLRYADHERFRKRSVATKVLDLACEEMSTSFGTRFLYVFFGWSAWPKASQVIPVGYFPEKLKKEVMGCFPNDYYEKEFSDNFDRCGFFRLTDPNANRREHKAAMKRYDRFKP